MWKNGELGGLKGGLGGGVHPVTGLYWADILTGALFQFAQLFSASHNFREIIRFYCPAGKLFGTVPGEVKHRLLIKTLLAMIVYTHHESIIQALWKYNVAYGNSKWKSTSKQATLSHAHELWAFLQLPTVLVWAGMLSVLYPLSKLVYFLFTAGGWLHHVSWCERDGQLFVCPDHFRAAV